MRVWFQDAGTGFADGAPADLVLGESGNTDAVRAVELADFDADGRLDLAAACSGSSNLALWFQESSGGFDTAPDQLLHGANNTFDVVAEDLDGDGLPDLASLNQLDNAVALYFASAAGSYPSTPGPLLGGFPVLAAPEELVAADVNGDGLPDLAAANTLGGTVPVFLQILPGLFDPSPRRVLGGAGSTEQIAGLTVRDLEGDGDADVVTANAGSDTVTIFWGSH